MFQWNILKWPGTSLLRIGNVGKYHQRFRPELQVRIRIASKVREHWGKTWQNLNIRAEALPPVCCTNFAIKTSLCQSVSCDVLWWMTVYVLLHTVVKVSFEWIFASPACNTPSLPAATKLVYRYKRWLQLLKWVLRPNVVRGELTASWYPTPVSRLHLSSIHGFALFLLFPTYF